MAIGGLQLPALVQRIIVDASGAADADRQIGGFASSVGSKFSDIAKGALALAGVTGIGAIGVSVVKTGADFTKSLNSMAAVAGVPGPELEKLRGLAIQLGRDTTFSANEAAGGMLELAKAGISTSDIMGGALANTLSLATAGELDLANAATVVGQAMNTFNLTGKDSQRIVDALAGAANSSSADVSDLALALSQGGQAAAMAGLTIEETTGALALFADNGLRGSDAGTSLKTALLNLVPTSKEAAGLMKELGLEFVNQDGSIKSLVEIQRELKEGLGGLTEAQQTSALKTIFGTDAYRAMGTLLNATEGELQGYIAATSEAGTASAVAEARMKGLPGIIERIKGGFETIQLVIYQLLEPALVFVGGAIATLLENLTDALSGIPNLFASVRDAVAPIVSAVAERLAPAFQAIGGFIRDNLQPILAGLAGFLGASLAPVLASLAVTVGGAVVGAFAALIGAISPVAVVIGVLVGAVTYAYREFEGFRNVVDAVARFLTGTALPAITGLAQGIGQAFAGTVGFVRDHWGQIQAVIQGVVGFLVSSVVPTVASFVQQVIGIFAGMAGFVRTHWDTISSIIGSAIAAVREVVVTTLTAVVGIVSELFSSLVQFTRDNWDSISQIVGLAITAVKVVVVAVVGAILLAWRAWGDELVSLVKTAWDLIQGIVKAATDIVLGVIQTVLAVITGDWSSAWDGIKMILSGVWEAMKTIVQTAVDVVYAIIEAALSLIRTLWDGAWEAIKGILSAAWDFIKNLVAAEIESMRAEISRVMDAVRAAWDAVWNAIQTILLAAWNAIRSATDAAMNAIRSVIDTVMGLIRALWETGWNAVRTVVTTAWDVISGVVRGGIEGVRSIVDSVMGAVQGAWQRAWDAMKGVVQGALDGIRGIWTGIRVAIGAPINAVLGFLNTLIRGANTVLSKVGLGAIPLLPSSVFHEGGVVGEDKGSRKGRTGKVRDDEEVALLQKGEGVLPKNVVSLLGRERFEELRKGEGELVAGPGLTVSGADKLPESVQRRLEDAKVLQFRPREQDALVNLPEKGGFLGGVFDAALNFLIDRAIDVVQGVISSIDGAMGAFGPPGRMAAYPPTEAGRGVIAFLEGLKRENEANAPPPAPGGTGAGTLPPGGGSIDRLIGFMKSTGVPHRVTSTYRPGARTGSGALSYHAQRRAVDFAGPSPGRDTPALGNIFHAFGPIMGQLLELIYAGPQTSFNIKNGRRVGKYAQAIHHDHVHAALRLGGKALANRVQLFGEDGPELAVPSAPMLTLDQRRTADVLSNRLRTEGMGVTLGDRAVGNAAGGDTNITVEEGAVQVSVTVTGAENPAEAGRRAGGAAAREWLAVIRAA